MFVTVLQRKRRGVVPPFDGQTLLSPTLANTSGFGFAVAELMSALGTQNVATPTIVNVSVLGAHTAALIDILTLDPTTIENAQTFGTHTIALSAGLATPTIVNSASFGAHTIANIDVQNLGPATITNSNAFGAHTITITPELHPDLIVNAQTFPATPEIRNDGVPPGGVATSYSNNGGTGSREYYIPVTAFGGPSGGTYDNFLDGDLSANSTGSWFWSTASTAWWVFDFRNLDPNGVVIDEFKWIQDLVNNHGGATFKFQGSNDNTNWTDIDSTFTLGGTTTTTVSRTQINFFKWYRIIKNSGSFSSGPWIEEIQFKISEHHPVVHPLITQVSAEAVHTAVSNMLVTQVSAEALNVPTSNMRVTQVSVESLRTWPPPVPPDVPEGDPPPSSQPQAWNTTTDRNTSLTLNYLQAGQVYPTTASGGAHKAARGVLQVYGKKYWEIHLGATQTLSSTGLGQKIAGVTLSEALGSDDESIAYRTDGKVRKNGADVTTYTTYGANGDTVMVAFDETSRKVWFGLNGTWNGNPAAGTGEAAIMPAGWYYPMDHVIDQPHLKLAIFDGYPKYVGPTFHVDPVASPPSGFAWFDPNV